MRYVVHFGSSGIRGVFGKDITPELFVDIGRSVASRYGRIILGRDVRTSGPALASAFIGGALASGASVHDGGVVSTPTIAFAAKGYDCGVVVTASHNPPEYNGIKLWNSSGIAFDEAQQAEIEASLSAKSFESCSWDKIPEFMEKEDLSRQHADAIVDAISRVDLKVVVDCACGATSRITPYVLREMGCRVVSLNTQPDGHFPGRPAEPTEENLQLLKRTVVTAKADFGIAHDGDGDRVVAVDEKGNYVGGETLLPLLASKFAGKSIAVPVDASMAVDDVMGGGKVWRTRVGDVYVAQEVKRRKSEFGGEPSGTFIFPSWGLFPDGVYGAAYIASMCAKERLSDQISHLPSYPSLRGGFEFDPAHRQDFMEHLERSLAAFEGGELERLDGWRLSFGDGWGLVRLSGTEPKVRIIAEAREKSRTKEIYESLVSKVKAGLR